MAKVHTFIEINTKEIKQSVYHTVQKYSISVVALVFVLLKK